MRKSFENLPPSPKILRKILKDKNASAIGIFQSANNNRRV